MPACWASDTRSFIYRLASQREKAVQIALNSLFVACRKVRQ
jgi:hypothetical protein